MISVAYLDALQQLMSENKPLAVLTLLSKEGSAPQDLGSKCIVSLDSQKPFWGTIGGGKIEAKAIETCHEYLRSQNLPPSLLELDWNLRSDLGMHCGGAVRILVEFFNAHTPWKIVVFGSGHVAQSLVPLLCQLEAKIQVIDDRAEWLETIPNQKNLEKVLTDDWQHTLSTLDSDAFFVSVSRGYDLDLVICQHILQRCSPRYLGVIGSEIKGLQLKRALLKVPDINEDKMKHFYCPLGLPIGNNQPAEIAISISAQLLEIRGTTPACGT